MPVNSSYYNLFFKFIEKYGPSGFTAIEPADPLVVELEEKMEQNDQFFYIGEDLSNFNYPDAEILKIGSIFSKREMEIISLIGKSYSSEQIAEKLFLSPHTVNTHRRNILHKTGMSNMSELIYDLMERGLI